VCDVLADNWVSIAVLSMTVTTQMVSLQINHCLYILFIIFVHTITVLDLLVWRKDLL